MSILPPNEAPNSRWMVTPDLLGVRCLAIGANGVPVNATNGGQFQTAWTANAITTGNLATITFTQPHDFQVGQLIQAPSSASAVLRQCWLEVLERVGANGVKVRIPRNLTCAAASDANGEWTAWTRGDDSGLRGDVASGDDTGEYRKNPSLRVWIENHPNLLSYFPGAKRVLLVRKGSPDPETLYFLATPETAATYVNKPRVVRVSVVKLSGSGQAAAYIVSNGLATVGNGTSRSLIRQGVEHTVTVAGPGDYADGLTFDGAVNDFYAVAEFTRAFGTGLGDGAYTHRPAWVRAQGSITFPTLNGATVSFPTTLDNTGRQYSFPVNVYQESNGMLGTDVKAISWALEGIPDDIGEIIGSKETEGPNEAGEGPPTTFGHVLTGTGQVLTPSSLTQIAGVATLTFDVSHQLLSGMIVTVKGANQAAYNGDHVVTVVDATSVTFAVAAATVTPATGTISARLRYYAANYCTLNLLDRTFWLYAARPGVTWRSVSMDINRLIA